MEVPFVGRVLELVPGTEDERESERECYERSTLLLSHSPPSQGTHHTSPPQLEAEAGSGVPEKKQCQISKAIANTYY